MTPPSTAPQPAEPQPASAVAGWSLALLLAINLFNYIDRQILAAVEPEIRRAFFPHDDALGIARTGWLATAFLLSYMLLAPLFGWLADRMSRWIIIGCSVALWSLASGWSGLAESFTVLLITRIFVGIGEAGYGPAAPAILSDLYPVEKRGRILSLFYVAIPVGSAIGYSFGSGMAGWMGRPDGWRWPFYLVTLPGLLLALACFFRRDVRAVGASTAKPMRLADLLAVLRIPSFLLNTAGMAAMTFAIGGMQFWIVSYIVEFRAAEFAHMPVEKLLSKVGMQFGLIVVTSGLLATLAGGWLADRLRPRIRSAYFLVSGVGIILAFPATVAMLKTPFPWAWVLIFLACFFLFFNIGPTNAALANVTPPAVRGTAFAANIFLIHLLGDAISPVLIGNVAATWKLPDGRADLNLGFLVVSAAMLVAGVFWLIGMRYLPRDTAAVEALETPR